MTDEQLAALAVPATVLLRPDPRTHLELLVPFVRKHTPALA